MRNYATHGRYALLTAFFLILTSWTMNAQTLIDFDDVSRPNFFAASTPLSTEYSSQGVTFSGSGFHNLNQNAGFSVFGYSSPNHVAWNSSCCTSPTETLTFSPPTVDVSFLAGSSTGASLTAEAFNAGGISLGATTVSLTNTMQLVSLPFVGIATVVINVSDSGILDDLTFGPSCDTTPPSITCPSDITLDSDAGECGATATWTVPDQMSVLDYRQNGSGRGVSSLLSGMGLSVSSNTGRHNLHNLLPSQPWDLVILQVHSDTLRPFEVTAIENYVNGGGKMIMAYWDLDASVNNSGNLLKPIVGVSNTISFNSPKPVTMWDGSHPIASCPNSVTNLAVVNNTLLDDGDRLEPDATGTSLAGFVTSPTTNQTAIVMANSGHTFYHGFAGTDMAATPWRNLIENEVAFLLNPVVISQTAGLASGATFPIGTTTNTLVATDALGNSATCDFEVTVSDMEAPTITCPADISVSTDTGLCSAVVNWTVETDDNCTTIPTGAIALNYRQDGNDRDVGGILSDLGFTVTNDIGTGNLHTLLPSQPWDLVVLQVHSNSLTSAEVNAIINYINSGGKIIMAYWDLDGSSSINPMSGPLLQPVLGVANTISLSTPMPVSVWDTAHPIFTIPNTVTGLSVVNTSLFDNGDRLEPNATGTALAGFVGSPTTNEAAIILGNGGNSLYHGFASRNMDGASWDALVENEVTFLFNLITVTDMTGMGLTSGDAYPLGTTLHTMVAEDASGNTATCSFEVTVSDTEAPNAICQDATVVLDANGDGSITTGDIDNGSSDACGIDDLSLDITTFDCGDVGANSVVLTVEDNHGNMSTCPATVTVQDNTNPTAICQNAIVVLDANGDGSITTGDIDNGSNDACGIDDLSLDITSFDCGDVGANSVVLTVEDNNGNMSTCTATVTVQDNTNPTAICQDATVVLDTNGDGSITTGDIDNGSNDACGIDDLSLDITTFDCGDVGTNAVVLTVTDNNGNMSTCPATVTVQDNTNPSAICQDATVVLDTNGDGNITTGDIDNGSNDACGMDDISLDITSFDCDDVGANSVVLTVTDNNGNMSTCPATVTVQDNTNPTAICQDATVVLDANGDGSITTGDIDNGSNDACGIDDLSLDITTFDCEDVGTNAVELTVTDNNGNVDTCPATITVQDNTNPTAICKNITVSLDTDGLVNIAGTDVDNNSNDNCGIVDWSLDLNSFTCNSPTVNTVNLTVADNAGNEDMCSAMVTIIDPLFACCTPGAVCQDIAVELDAAGIVEIEASDIDNSTSDNCEIVIMSLDIDSFGCSEVGDNTVELSIEDLNSSTSNCTATVTVSDNVNPTALCQDATVVLDANGDGSITTGDIDNGSNDACGIDDLSLDITSFDCGDVGTNAVELTVTDNNGNVDTCPATITVQDNTNPIAICQDATVVLDANGDGSITTGDIDNGSNDACGIDDLSLDITTFDCGDVGTNAVELTVTDNNGNVDTCPATVTVQDNTNPIAICQDATVVLDANGDGSITTADIDNGSNDACGIDDLSLDITTFDCGDVGTNAVVLTVTDNNGNMSTCPATVTVQDNTNPIAICQDATVVLDVNGDGNITTADIDNGSNDACGIDDLSLDITSFTCAEVGDNAVVLTVTDNNGNVDTCPATVTVQDNTPAEAICRNLALELDQNGSAEIVGTDLDGGSTDACGIAVLTATPNTFDCSNVGSNFATLSITDEHGNTSKCIASAQIFDTAAPVMLCNDLTLQLDQNGDASITVADVDGGSSDNCDFSMSLSPTAFTCAELGNNTVTLTGIDEHTNVATCEATITIQDTQAPVIICAPLFTSLEVDGTLTITPDEVDGGTTDNCDFDLSVSPNTFNCDHVDANIVELTAIDEVGNSSTCLATVTIRDETAANPVCQDITVQSDENGDVSIEGSDIDNGSADACGIADLSVLPNAFDCSHIGGNAVELTVTDNNGNTSTCAATVTVEDNVSPVAICQGATAYLDADGMASIVPADIDGESVDNCTPITYLSAVPDAFTCEQVGNNTVVLSIEDDYQNTASCEATVTILDEILPEITCPADVLTCELDGFAQFDMPTASDNCGVASITTDIQSATLFAEGVTTVTGTVEDVNGNTNTCSFTVTYSRLRASIAQVSDYNGYNVSCAGSADGWATVIVSGGFGDYTYNWSDGQTTPTATDLAAGFYSVEVTSELGCVTTSTISLDEPQSLKCSASSTNVSCYGEMDGTASVIGGNGVAPYMYSWTGDNGYTGTGAMITDLDGGEYTVLTTDANGCECSQTITVEEPEAGVELAMPVVTGVQEECVGPFCYNVATVEFCGGTFPYDISWETEGYVRYAIEYDEETGCSIITVNYTDAAYWMVNVSDESSCSSDVISVGSNDIGNGESTLMVAEALTTCAAAASDCLDGGSIELVVEGGAAPYTYDWTGPMGSFTGTAFVDGLGQGWYTVVITDSSSPVQVTENQIWVGCAKPGRDCGSTAKEIGETDELSIEENFSVYPNPMNEQGTVNFRLAMEEPTKVEVFSVEGRQVAVLFDGIAQANMPYELNLEANSLVAGIYVCRLTTASGKIMNQQIVIVSGK